LAAHLSENLKQTVLVDNRTGAGGSIAAEYLAKSAADGYTLLVGIDSTFTINPHIYTQGFTQVSDLDTLAVVGSSGMLIGVNADLGIKTLPNFLSEAGNREFNFASGGNGSPGHLSMAQIAQATGARLNHVPYKGNAPAVLAIISGHVQGGTLAKPGMLPHVKSGKISALAVTSRQRSPLLPTVPTVGEAGFDQLGFEVLYVVMAPKGLPSSVSTVLRRAFADAVKDPGVVQRFQQLDLQPETLSGETARVRLEEQAERYGRLVNAAGVTVN